MAWWGPALRLSRPRRLIRRAKAARADARRPRAVRLRDGARQRRRRHARGVFAVGCVETAWQWKRRSRAVTPLSGSGIPLAIIGYLLLALCLLIVLRIGQAVPEGRAALDLLRN
jgi:hypothetical protein